MLSSLKYIFYVPFLKYYFSVFITARSTGKNYLHSTTFLTVFLFSTEILFPLKLIAYSIFRDFKSGYLYFIRLVLLPSLYILILRKNYIYWHLTAYTVG